MESARPPTRRLRLFLRDFRMVEAIVGLAEGRSLVAFFAHRRSYINVREARWTGTTDEVDHAALRIDQVLWAAAMDGDIPLTTASDPQPGRRVELQLDGGLLMRGLLMLGGRQRLSDYLDTAGPFIPVREAQLLRSGRPTRQTNVELGDIVINQAAVQAVWEEAMQRARFKPPTEA